mgnify:CR=1 FL=1
MGEKQVFQPLTREDKITVVLYRIGIVMGRGPGSTPRFAITYLDAHGKTLEWLPAWQHKTLAHVNWLPSSPERTCSRSERDDTECAYAR